MKFFTRPEYLAALVFAAALAGVRLAGEKSVAFQAAAHVFVGLLLGLAWGRKSWYPASVAIALTVVEVIAFFAVK